MLDLLIRGGEVVTPQGVGKWDVAIQGERIVAVDMTSTVKSDDDPRIAGAVCLRAFTGVARAIGRDGACHCDG